MSTCISAWARKVWSLSMASETSPPSISMPMSGGEAIIRAVKANGIDTVFGIPAAHNIATVTLVFNNNAYGNVCRDQLNTFDGRLAGADLLNPDFVKLADSFGVEAHRVATPDQLRPLLGAALDAGRPVLLEVSVPTGSETNPWQYIHMKDAPIE